MLTFEEIKKIGDYLTEVFKDVFATKDELMKLESKMDSRFDQLQTSVDGLAKLVKDTSQETLVNGYRMDRLEKWAKRAGGKIDVKFDT